jgi:hypothetical protein
MVSDEKGEDVEVKPFAFFFFFFTERGVDCYESSRYPSSLSAFRADMLSVASNIVTCMRTKSNQCIMSS